MENINPWNSKYKSQQGNIGLGMAIAYYTSKNIPVMIPLNDTQKYDLVIDKDNILQKVSVKTTQYLNKNGTNYIVRLSNCGGASGKNITRKFDNSTCDIVFILVKDGTMYEIPSNIIKVANDLTLTDKFDQHIVNIEFQRDLED